MLKLIEERSHFSHNQLITMLSCPHKYYLQYILGKEWDFVPSAVSFGSAVHESLRGFHSALMNGGVKDRRRFISDFRECFQKDKSEKLVIFRDKDEYDELLSKGEKLISEYTQNFEKIKPAEVEMEFRLPLVNTYTGSLLEKDIVGRIDMISADDCVYEIKTSSYAASETSIAENLQLILYGWSFKMIYGRSPKKLVLVNLIKTKQPKVQVLDTTLDDIKERKLLQLMFMVNDAIEKQAFYPNPRGSFGCSSCPYMVSCEHTF